MYLQYFILYVLLSNLLKNFEKSLNKLLKMKLQLISVSNISNIHLFFFIALLHTICKIKIFKTNKIIL